MRSRNYENNNMNINHVFQFVQQNLSYLGVDQVRPLFRELKL